MNDRSETGNPKNSCYWSLGSYPGWIQSRYRPDELDYTPWTHLMHFAMYPTWDGRLGNGEISDSNADAAVEAAHEAGVPIILVVGGEGYGSQFTIATDEAHRAQFVSDIVDRISKHGYDGISVDWEEYVHGHEAQLIALVRELRIALDSVDDGLFWLIDVIVGLV